MRIRNFGVFLEGREVGLGLGERLKKSFFLFLFLFIYFNAFFLEERLQIGWGILSSTWCAHQVFPSAALKDCLL